MDKVVLALMSGVAAPVIADNTPYVRTIADGLSQMPLQEKQNAIIRLILEEGASDQALSVAHEVERSWNNGEFDTAIELLDRLAELTNLENAAVSGDWRTPAPTVQPSRFGTDALISNRDSVLQVEVEVHVETGNLIAVVLQESDGWLYSMFSSFSDDGGNTWYEKSFLKSNLVIGPISAAMMSDYCYVAYNFSNTVELRRYRYDTGYREDWFPGGYAIPIYNGSIKELSLVANDGWPGDVDLFLVISETSGELILYRLDVFLLMFTPVNTGISDCDRGLDAIAASSEWFPVFISYII